MNSDRIAGIYRWLEYVAFGRALERCRFRLLPHLAGRRRVLIVGEGDGRFLEKLCEQNADAVIEVVELSGEMIALAKSRSDGKVRFHQQNALERLPEGEYDAVVTNFLLDCLSGREAALFIEAAAARLTSGGVWLVGEFHLPERGWRRWHAQLWLRTMYCFFAAATGLRATEIPDYPRLLEQQGLKREEQHFQRAQLLTAEVWRKI